MTLAIIFDSVGAGEWVILLAVLLVVMGPKRLPATARKVGAYYSKFRRAAESFKRQIMDMDLEMERELQKAEQEVSAEIGEVTGEVSAEIGEVTGEVSAGVDEMTGEVTGEVGEVTGEPAVVAEGAGEEGKTEGGNQSPQES